MDAIDAKLIEAVKALPENLKKQVLDYIQNIITQNPELYKTAKKARKYSSDNIDESSVAENSSEYLSKDQLIDDIQNLPQNLQTEFWRYLDKLKMKAQKLSKQDPIKEEGNKKFIPKPGFGGGKGFFILKEGWDDPLTEEFKDYM